MMETARGRWFLSEFSRRNRHADTGVLLDAIGRLETAMIGDRGATGIERIRFDLAEMARAMIAAAPERCVWGSDWPHPTESAEHKPDDAVLFDLLAACVPDEAARRRVLVDNPAELYDFPKA